MRTIVEDRNTLCIWDLSLLKEERLGRTAKYTRVALYQQREYIPAGETLRHNSDGVEARNLETTKLKDPPDVRHNIRSYVMELEMNK